jgi:hypothetical protein
VGANRDERPDRQSEPFALRQSDILCPLDVRGGTWIGVNKYGVFAALTNLDRNEPSNRGRHSRGFLVLKALGYTTAADAVTEVVGMLMENTYNAFNLLIANQKRMVAVVGHGASRRVELIHFAPGLHVATGWGVDSWSVPRAEFIRRGGLSASPSEWHPWTNVDDMKQLLSHHSTEGDAKSSVCIHDPDESHVTVSSCIIEVKNGPQIVGEDDRKWQSISVQHVETPPCKAEFWNKVTMYCE